MICKDNSDLSKTGGIGVRYYPLTKAVGVLGQSNHDEPDDESARTSHSSRFSVVGNFARQKWPGEIAQAFLPAASAALAAA